MSYRAPLNDTLFTLKHIVRFDELVKSCGLDDLDLDLASSILSEAGKFAQEVFLPLSLMQMTNHDDPAVIFKENQVRFKAEFKKAYETWRDGGWATLGGPEGYGGQNLPQTLSLGVSEYWSSIELGFTLGFLLTQGAIETINHFGTDEQKQILLPKMVDGTWTGTMNLTEPGAGSDLGAIKTSATLQDDGSFKLKGTKIFISFGDHDLAENIIHLVLARIKGATPGTKGLSLFIVPKFLINDDGTSGAQNDVITSGVEHKMGIHTSPTCTLTYGEKNGAIGYLLGAENKGLKAMFMMMNRARLGVGNQGIGIAERAIQQAEAYANERKQGKRSYTPKGEMTMIINHPNVRQKIIHAKSLIAAARAICQQTAKHIDLSQRATDEAIRKDAGFKAALYTPLAKAFSTDISIEVTSEALQVHGGMGYIEETGAASFYRDARILPIYEGTNGIQALDLIFRKLPLEGGEIIKQELAAILTTSKQAIEIKNDILNQAGIRLGKANKDFSEVCAHLGTLLTNLTDDNQQLLEAVANDFLTLASLVFGAHFMIDGALSAQRENDEYLPEYLPLVDYFTANSLAETASLKLKINQSGPVLLAHNGYF